jgi:cytochrome P450/NADPH-cytochrome P450 reductase
MLPEMDDIAEQMCAKWERVGDHSIIDIVDNLTRLTLDTIALCGFDYRFNSFYSTDMHPFVDAMVDSLIEAGSKSRRSWVADKLMIKSNKKYKTNINLMNKTADEVVAERKKNPKDVNDLLNRMLNGRDPVTGAGLSDENIRYQLITFLIAGHETTSGMLSFALYQMIKHPEVLRKAQEEVDTIAGVDQISLKHLSQFTYLDQILKETLRLHPTAPAFVVSSEKDEVIGGKYQVKAGEPLIISLIALHKDKKVWGENAAEFDPDRMSPEKFAALPKNSWKPFGNGMRACIGRPFAWQEGLLVLAKVLQRFDIIDHDPSYKLQTKESLTMKPAGFFIRSRVRKSWINRKPRITSAPTESQSIKSPLEVEAHRGPLNILFGSNSGTCESFANTLQEDAKARGYDVTIAHLNANAGNLPINGPILIATASYEGQPTDDAAQFVAWLTHIREGSLKGIKYAVVGAGHTDWVDTYQRIPKFIDSKLEFAGAERLIARGEVNAAGDVQGDFDEWRNKLWNILTPGGEEEVLSSKVSAEIIHGSRDTLLRVKNLRPGQVLSNVELVKESKEGEVSRSKRHIVVSLPEGMTYRAGDYLAVLPINPMGVVNKVISHFALQHDDKITLKSGKANRNNLACPLDEPVSVTELLLHYFELSLPATKRNILALMECTQNTLDRQKLQEIADETDKNSKESAAPSIIDVLRKYTSISLSFGAFIEMLVPMRVRQYSISSSPLWSPNKCTITVGVLNAPSWKGEGNKEGVASNFLASCLPGTMVSMMTRASSFKLPEDQKVPIIMVAAGTGIAPFRGFIQERAELIKKQEQVGAGLLFFGCRNPDIDYVYRDELQQWSNAGAVKLRCVFSRAPEKEGICYVQHKIWEQKEEVAALLDQDAHIFVCGEGTGMGAAVKKVFVEIYKEHKQCTQEEAEARMSSMDKRYSVDVFA